MESGRQSFFEDHPDPTWVCEPAGMRILAANKAAVATYGYSADEFRALSLDDLIAPPDRSTPHDGWFTRHRLKSGPIICVETRSQAIDVDGRRAVLVAARDVTRYVAHSAALPSQLTPALDSISDGLFILDTEWRFTFVNAEALRLLGRTEDLRGRNIWEELPKTVGSIFHKKYHEAVERQELVSFIEYFAPLETWLNVRAYPLPTGLAVYLLDVTDRRSEQEQLRLLESAISRTNDILLITEAEPIDAPDGPRIVYVNDAFVRQTGFTREEAIGQTPRILQGPKTQRAELDKIHDAMREWKPVRSELINYTKDGEEFWLDLNIVPIANEKGWFTHWVSIERDITYRKQAEQAARFNEERLRLIVKATDSVMWDWNFETDEVWFNDALLDVFGHDQKVIGTSSDVWISLVHPADRDRITEAIRAKIASASRSWAEEYRFMRADGTAAIVADRGGFMYDETGKAIRMIGCLVDVTERRAMAERLRQSQKLEAIGQLTGGIAHDFNNLLTVILGSSEELIDSLDDNDDLKMLAEMAATAAERGAELTNRLLAFGRRQALAPKVVDFNKMIAGMDSLLRRTLSENIEIEFLKGADLWSALVDPSQLEVAVVNLAINARDAMPKGGRLTIEAGNAPLDGTYPGMKDAVIPGDYVLVSVSDTGIGMTPEVAERAFEPFFTTKQFGEGGLGLSMVYGFVKQSGGHAAIYSEVGEGTTVKLYLPRTVVENDTANARPSGGTSALVGTEHILIVEDEKLVRDHATMLLKGLGYRVTSAMNGPEALEIVKRSFDIDLLFTDVVMPGGMNGPQLADHATALKPNLRVLFTSGYTDNALIHHGRVDRGVQLLSKPYRRQDLAAKVRQVLDETLN